MKNKILLLSALFCIAVGSVFADKQVTIDLSAKYGTETNVTLSTVEFDDLTLTFEAGEGTAPIYNYNHFRLNDGNTMTVKGKEGKKIVSILFNFAAQKKFETLTITPTTYTYDAETRTLSGEDSNEVALMVGGTQARITSMVVTMNEGGAAAADPEEFNLRQAIAVLW